MSRNPLIKKEVLERCTVGTGEEDVIPVSSDEERGRERSRMLHLTSKPAPRGAKARRGRSEGRARDFGRSLSPEGRRRDRSNLRRRSDSQDRRGSDTNSEVDVDSVPPSVPTQEPAEERGVPENDGRGRSEQAELTNEQAAAARIIMRETSEQMAAMVGERNCPVLGNVKEEGGRGRCATTGDYYLKMLREAQKAVLAQTQDLINLWDESVGARYSEGRKREEKAAMEELRNTPSGSLAAIILEAVNGIDKVLEKSSTLQGPMRGMLNKSAAQIKTAITLLAQRRGQRGPREEEEMEEMRLKISEQNKELEALKESKTRQQKELDELREELAKVKAQAERRAVSPEPVERQGRKAAKRRRVKELSSTSSSEEDDISHRNGIDQEGGMDAEMGMDIDADMHQEGEEEVENSRQRVLAELEEQGVPAALRPPLQGRRAVLEPAVPPAGERQDREEEERNSLSAQMRELREMVLSLSQTVKGTKEGPVKTEERKDTGKENNKGKAKKGKAKKSEPFPALPAVKQTQVQRPWETPTPVPTSAAPGRKERPQVQRGKTIPAPAPTGSADKARPGPREDRGTETGERSEEGIWVQVVKRGGKKKKERNEKGEKKPEGKAQPKGQQPPSATSQRGKKVKRRAPKTAAVILTCPEEQYSEYMGIVREKISLQELGIEKPLNVRRTATGALSLEISGQDNADKADVLAERMRAALTGKEGVRINRPSVTADLRLSGFEGSVSAEKIARTIAETGKVHPSAVAVGPIRRMGNGLCSAVVKCPVGVANTLAREGKLALGWARTKIELLDKRPLQCFKCMELGHTRATCRSEADRTGVCYRCGEAGHEAKVCVAAVSCAVCRGKGLAHDHRVGGARCTGCHSGKRKAPAAPAKDGPTKQSAQAKAKGKKKPDAGPRIVESLVVEGFRVTHDGKMVAGTSLGPAPKEKKTRPKREESGKIERMEVDVLPPSKGETRKPPSSPLPLPPPPQKMEVEEEKEQAVPTEEDRVAEDLVGYL